MENQNELADAVVNVCVDLKAAHEAMTNGSVSYEKYVSATKKIKTSISSLEDVALELRITENEPDEFYDIETDLRLVAFVSASAGFCLGVLAAAWVL